MSIRQSFSHIFPILNGHTSGPIAFSGGSNEVLLPSYSLLPTSLAQRDGEKVSRRVSAANPIAYEPGLNYYRCRREISLPSKRLRSWENFRTRTINMSCKDNDYGVAYPLGNAVYVLQREDEAASTFAIIEVNFSVRPVKCRRAPFVRIRVQLS